MTYYTLNEDETVKLGKEFSKKLCAGDVIAFTGGLGAGKTAFTRGIAAGLELSSRVSSPTFTIVNEYLGKMPLFHFDMYRLKDADELFEIGWEDYLARGGVCAVEWSENVAGAFPPETVYVSIEKTGDNTRKIEITWPEGRAI